jgi:AraC-like DNA-binding protein
VPALPQTCFITAAPPAAIAQGVFELWQLEDDGRLHAGLPKPYVEVVVSLSGLVWWRPAMEGAEHLYCDAWVTPIQSGPRYARAVGRRHLIGARLEPWAALALFGPLPPGDGTPPPRLAELWGADEERALVGALRAAGSDAARFALFGRWLADQSALGGERPDFGALADAARAGSLAEALGVHPRTLRRNFARAAGLSPKRWLRLHRLDAVLRRSGAGGAEQSLADLAQEMGYADQAHLTRDVAALTGATPAALQRRGPSLPPHLFPLS